MLSVCTFYSNISVPLDRFSKGKNLKPENKLQKQADFPREVNKSKKQLTLTKCNNHLIYQFCIPYEPSLLIFAPSLSCRIFKKKTASNNTPSWEILSVGTCKYSTLCDNDKIIHCTCFVSLCSNCATMNNQANQTVWWTLDVVVFRIIAGSKKSPQP